MRQDPASAELTRDAGSPCEQRQLSRFDELAFVMFAVILGTVRNQGQPMPAHVDPITRAVVQHRLSAIVAEMGEAMLRTSYSQILNSSRDFSLAICDVQARLIAQADHIPVHVGALPWATRAVEERIRDVQPGDVILMNDPYHGGSHLPDVTAFVPVFNDGKRLFWTIVRAHQSDIGGATHGAYNPMATEIYQEGLRIPPMKLYEAGRLREDVLDMIALNIRNPRDFRGDLAAMVGAAHLGERRLTKLFTEFDAATVAQAIEDIWTRPSSRPAPSSQAGRTASSTARRCSTTTAMAAATFASLPR
jgi:N-methylhydantoinase B